jgi:hypothetical protein
MDIIIYDAQGQGRGKLILPITRPKIRPSSKVFASISELNPSNRESFIGAARMTVHNVSPREGSVLVWVDIEWPNDLIFTVNLMVVNNT